MSRSIRNLGNTMLSVRDLALDPRVCTHMRLRATWLVERSEALLTKIDEDGLRAGDQAACCRMTLQNLDLILAAVGDDPETATLAMKARRVVARTLEELEQLSTARCGPGVN
ncbi:MAG: hypothetical protein AB7K24_01770 [Gemmataceae bacterium]